MKVIVGDTTSLIVLEGLQSLNLLCAVFETILIPQAVLHELSVGSPDIIKQDQAMSNGFRISDTLYQQVAIAYQAAGNK